MRNRKKVSGERLGAAIIDSIIVSIVSIIPIAIYMAITVDWSNALDSLLVNLTFGESGYANFLFFTIGSELIIGIIYFAFMPFKMNGQTIGKKILRIKAVDEYGENPSLMKHTIRAIQNWGGYFTVPMLLLLLFTSQEVFVVVLGIFGNLVNLVVFISLILIFSREDGRGIHDMLAGTYVVHVDEDFNKEFAMKTAQMSEWAEIEDDLDSGFNTNDEVNEEEKDDWNF